LERLRGSIAGVDIHRVSYREPGSLKQEPTLTQLATEKRLMFAYEQEVRVLLKSQELGKYTLAGPFGSARGIAVDWNPDANLEAIFVHPDADGSFFDTVVTTVEHYAPTLKDKVQWSAMQKRPPF
jgi:hypothetical protein